MGDGWGERFWDVIDGLVDFGRGGGVWGWGGFQKREGLWLEVEVEDGRRCGISGGDAGCVCGMVLGTAVESDAAKLRAVGNVLRLEGKLGGGGLLWGVRVVESLRLREMWRRMVEVDVVEIDNLKIGIVKVDRF